MDRGDNFADSERLDQATKLLIASLKESKALNDQIRKTLHRQQVDAVEQSGRSANMFQLLEDIVRSFE